jgi:hypothetical protein
VSAENRGSTFTIELPISSWSRIISSR